MIGERSAYETSTLGGEALYDHQNRSIRRKKHRQRVVRELKEEDVDPNHRSVESIPIYYVLSLRALFDFHQY